MQDQRFLKYRSLILRCVAACLFLAEDIYPTKLHFNTKNEQIAENGGQANNMGQVLTNLLEKLQAHHDEVNQKEVNYKALESPIQGPDRSRLTLFVESHHCSLLMELFRAVLECSSKTGKANPENYLSNASKIFGEMTEQIINSASSHSLKNREEFFEKLVSIVEVNIPNFFSLSKYPNFNIFLKMFQILLSVWKHFCHNLRSLSKTY